MLKRVYRHYVRHGRDSILYTSKSVSFTSTGDVTRRAPSHVGTVGGSSAGARGRKFRANKRSSETPPSIRNSPDGVEAVLLWFLRSPPRRQPNRHTV